MLSKKPNRVNFTRTGLRSTDVAVAPALAYDVRDVADLVKMGKPISLVNASTAFYDGDSSDDMSVPLDRQRGVDLNMMYQESKESKRKIGKFNLKNKEK